MMDTLSIDDVRFRGRPLDALTREELTEALLQALNQLHQREAYLAVGSIDMLKGRLAHAPAQTRR